MTFALWQVVVAVLLAFNVGFVAGCAFVHSMRHARDVRKIGDAQATGFRQGLLASNPIVYEQGRVAGYAQGTIDSLIESTKVAR